MKRKQKITEFFFKQYLEILSNSRTFVRGKHSAWTPTAKMAAPPRTVLAHQLRQSGRSPAAKPLPLLFLATSKNCPFAIWTDLLPQLLIMKIPQYTKYSGISITRFGTKSLAQIIKKQFSAVAGKGESDGKKSNREINDPVDTGRENSHAKTNAQGGRTIYAGLRSEDVHGRKNRGKRRPPGIEPGTSPPR